MALGKKAALEAAAEIMSSHRVHELPRLQKIKDALRPVIPPDELVPTINLPQDAPQVVRDLARKSRTNYLPLLVKTFAQVMKVDDYLSKTEGGKDPWHYWQINRMDARQAGLTRAALAYGAAYATVLPGQLRGQRVPAIRTFSPMNMTAIGEDPSVDEWPMMALGQFGDHAVLYDEEAEYWFGLEKPGFLPSGMSLPLGQRALTYLETRPHGLGVCPVVRYRDRFLTDDDLGGGIVEPLFEVQSRIDETTFEMMIAQYFAAFRQRYVLGWIPESEDEELRAGAGYAWYLSQHPDDVKVGELEQTSPSPYLESLASAKRDFAALGQVPAQSIGLDGVSNISDATLAGLEAAKNRESDEITTSLGESHEQLFRLASQIDGNVPAADDYDSEVRWRDFEARSFAQTVDGLVKLATGLGLPAEVLLEDVPGYSGQKLERAKVALRKERAGGMVAGLATESASSTSTAANSAAADAAALKSKFDALGIAIRSGVDPANAARVVGLSGVQFTGAIPVSLRPPAEEAARLEDK